MKQVRHSDPKENFFTVDLAAGRNAVGGRELPDGRLLVPLGFVASQATIPTGERGPWCRRQDSNLYSLAGRGF